MIGAPGFVGFHLIKNLLTHKQNNFLIDVLDNIVFFTEISNKEKIKNKIYDVSDK